VTARSILIIDSDAESRASARSLFDGHDVSDASSISEAQRLLAGGDFDLAIIGPGLAHQSGFLEARVLTETNPEFPFVCLVGGLCTDVLRPAMRNGFSDLLDVPLDEDKAEIILGHVSELAS